MSALTATVYALDLERLVLFYRALLELAVLESAAGDFTTLVSGTGDIEISVVQIPADAAATIELSDPVEVRHAASIKLSFLVRDLAMARSRAEMMGALMQPIDQAWAWRGHLHCDGCDPEGNVFQLRAAAP